MCKIEIDILVRSENYSLVRSENYILVRCNVSVDEDSKFCFKNRETIPVCKDVRCSVLGRVLPTTNTFCILVDFGAFRFRTTVALGV